MTGHAWDVAKADGLEGAAVGYEGRAGGHMKRYLDLLSVTRCQYCGRITDVGCPKRYVPCARCLCRHAQAAQAARWNALAWYCTLAALVVSLLFALTMSGIVR